MDVIMLLFRYIIEISAAVVSALSIILVSLNGSEMAGTAQKLLMKQIAIFAMIIMLSLVAYAVAS